MKTRLVTVLLLAAAPLWAEGVETSALPKMNPRLAVPADAAAPPVAVALPTEPAHAVPAPALPPVAVTLPAVPPALTAAAVPLPDGKPQVNFQIPAALPEALVLPPGGGLPVAATPPLPVATPVAPAAAPAPVAAPVAAVAEVEPSPRPKSRPEGLADSVTKATAGGGTMLASSLRPKDRPKDSVLTAAPAAKAAKAPEVAMPEEVEPVAMPAPKAKSKDKAKASKKGSVCGVAAIKGEEIAPITSKVKGCGLADGVRVTSVSGVRLSMAITVDCNTAKALNTWVDQLVQPAYGGAVVELKIAGHYICRPRNNIKGGKISEHGRGKAVDIGGFALSSGKVVMVAGGYNKTMRKVHQQACGLFGTTLGPGSDGYHEDHLHLDTASHRSPYCR